MRIPGVLAALASLAALAATPTRAHAQTRTITCESRGDERNDCYIANLDQGSVSVDRKLSKSGCEKGESWGTSRDNIWVSRGCRAVFAYRARSGSSSSGGGGGGGGRFGTIVCESRGDERKECYVSNLDPESVTMDQLLSKSLCEQGRSWDATGNIIWVSKGCRARFAYVTRSGGSGGYNNGYSGSQGGGSSRAGREACIERASREWAVTEENLEITGTNRLDDGQTELLVSSKRTKGSCYVDSNGRVRRFSTW